MITNSNSCFSAFGYSECYNSKSLELNLYVHFVVVAERDALAISKSPHIVHLFYSFQSKDQIELNLYVHFVVVAERDALAISKSPHIVHLFYSFQSKDQIFLVRSVI